MSSGQMRRTALHLLIGGALSLVGIATALGASSDPGSPLHTVERLFDAMAAHDATAVRAVLADTATLISVRRGADGHSSTQLTTGAQFATSVGGATEPWMERMIQPDVQVRDDIAWVSGRYEFRRAGARSHCGMQLVSLVRDQGRWQIVHVSYTVERPCVSIPEP